MSNWFTRLFETQPPVPKPVVSKAQESCIDHSKDKEYFDQLMEYANPSKYKIKFDDTKKGKLFISFIMGSYSNEYLIMHIHPFLNSDNTVFIKIKFDNNKVIYVDDPNECKLSASEVIKRALACINNSPFITVSKKSKLKVLDSFNIDLDDDKKRLYVNKKTNRAIELYYDNLTCYWLVYDKELGLTEVMQTEKSRSSAFAFDRDRYRSIYNYLSSLDDFKDYELVDMDIKEYWMNEFAQSKSLQRIKMSRAIDERMKHVIKKHQEYNDNAIRHEFMPFAPIKNFKTYSAFCHEIGMEVGFTDFNIENWLRNNNMYAGD